MPSPRPVPRQTRPDAETEQCLYLIKNVTELRATYQVRLNALRAIESGRKLVIQVPPHCRFHPSLLALIQATENVIERQNLP